ncbi:PAS domain S-box-containing protein [Nocardioides scoriae]|uniref:histidine kinase n=1 Tax=Nocardioides scoriae TaxID=642780 RepID=A0A1H1U7X7_9ACTN|nr:ATP-binding protein [Nocardioides scoriae]SDS67939.1 PAS domain S-box-containing protein [Nocardioides scoriae]
MHVRQQHAAHAPRYAMTLTGLVLVVVATAVQSRGLVAPGLPSTRATSDLCSALASVVGALACAWAGLRSPSTDPASRRAWAGLGLGVGLWAVADAVWFGYEAAGSEPPYPGPADLLYFLGIAVVGVAMVLLTRGSPELGGRNSRITLDTMVLASAMTLVTYLLVLRRVVEVLGPGTEAVLSVVYPVADAVFAALAGVLLVRSRSERERGDLLLLTLGFGAYWVADGYFAVADAIGTTDTVDSLGLGYVLAPLLVGLAGTTAGTDGGRLSGTPGSLTRGLSAILPDVGVFAAILACAAGTLRTEFDWVLTTSVLALMAYRQALIATSNQRVRSALEERVLDRTASLQWLSDHHEGILASMGEGVMGVDAEGRVTFANPAAAGVLGADGEALLGTDLCTITCPSDHQDGERCLTDVVRETGTAITRPSGEFARVDDTRFPVEVTAAPRRGPGLETGMVLVFRDTTERQAMARMKNQFVSAVSHELRTPLTSIRGALEMLSDGDTGELPASAGSMVETALRGSERLTRLVNDIIDVERLESGSFPMYFAEHAAAAVVEASVSGLEVLAAEAGVTLVVDGAEGLVRADADRLVQALVNLVGNAVKFSPPGSEVHVEARTVGPAVQFTVSDSGRGIPASHLELVFERFAQVEVSDAREKAGTGLGLPITRSIVEQHGGRIWVESVPGEGSTFAFTVPVAQVEAPAQLAS